jgi:hypothetical protein
MAEEKKHKTAQPNLKWRKLTASLFISNFIPKMNVGTR